MSKNSLTLSLNGVDELLKDIEKMGGNVNEAAEKAIMASAQPFTQDLKLAIAKHRRSGLTESALRSPQQVKWEGNRCSLHVGFDMAVGGLPAIFLEYGTSRMSARPFIRPAISRAKRNMVQLQSQALHAIMKDLKP